MSMYSTVCAIKDGVSGRKFKLDMVGNCGSFSC